MDRLSAYVAVGDPDIPYVPSRRDLRRQTAAERSREVALAPDWPRPSRDALIRAKERFDWVLSNPPPDHMLMRWRLRLFCGHVVEETAHADHKDVARAFGGTRCCSECAQDPVVIVAARPLGLKGKRPRARRPPRQDPAVLRDRLLRTEAKADYLRKQLSAAEGPVAITPTAIPQGSNPRG